MLIIRVTSKTTRWMCHRARLGCQKKLKITTNQSKIEQQKEKTETCLFRWRFLLFCVSVVRNPQWKSQQPIQLSTWTSFALTNIGAVLVANNFCSVLVFISGPTDASRWRILYFHIAFFYISPALTGHRPMSFKANGIREQRNEQKREKIIEQFNHSNWQWKIDSVYRLNGRNEILH